MSAPRPWPNVWKRSIARRNLRGPFPRTMPRTIVAVPLVLLLACTERERTTPVAGDTTSPAGATATAVVQAAAQPESGYATPEELRDELRRVAARRSSDVTRHLGGMGKHVFTDVNGQADGIVVPLSSYFSAADSSSTLWPALEKLLASAPVVRDSNRWLFDDGTNAIQLSRIGGKRWRVTWFQMPGGGNGEPELAGSNYGWEDSLARDRAVRATGAAETVVIEVLSVEGYDAALARNLLARQAAALVKCLSARDVTARIRLTLGITGNTAVSEGDEANDELNACLMRWARKAVFAQPNGGSARIVFTATTK